MGINDEQGAATLTLKRPNKTVLRFSREVKPNCTLFDASVRVGAAQWRAVFATAKPNEVRIYERDRHYSASVWLSDASFDLEDNEVERVREFFGLPQAAKAGVA